MKSINTQKNVEEVELPVTANSVKNTVTLPMINEKNIVDTYHTPMAEVNKLEEIPIEQIQQEVGVVIGSDAGIEISSVREHEATTLINDEKG